eukprot:766905-Hanusia_phi.AAC.2
MYPYSLYPTLSGSPCLNLPYPDIADLNQYLQPTHAASLASLSNSWRIYQSVKCRERIQVPSFIDNSISQIEEYLKLIEEGQQGGAIKQWNRWPGWMTC